GPEVVPCERRARVGGGDARVGAGRPTRDGTAAWAARHGPTLGPAAYGPLGATGLTVSRVGFGGYRVDDDTPEHRAALERAFHGGVNLVDTSTNYTDGGSERLGRAGLADLAGRQRRRRGGGGGGPGIGHGP